MTALNTQQIAQAIETLREAQALAHEYRHLGYASLSRRNIIRREAIDAFLEAVDAS